MEVPSRRGWRRCKRGSCLSPKSSWTMRARSIKRCAWPGSAPSSTTATRSWATRSATPRCGRSPTCSSSAAARPSRAPSACGPAPARTGGPFRSIGSGPSCPPRSHPARPTSPWAGRDRPRPSLLHPPRHGDARGATPLSKAQEIRINEAIRVREVRVVSADGEQLGIIPTVQALETARGQDLDLVEVAPEANPPVCRIMDFGKYKYTQARRLKEARKKQTTISVKEVKMGPKTEKHDFDFKVKHVRRFLEEGHKAKVTVRFKGREMAHTELGWKMLQKMVEAVTDIAVADNNPRMEGRMLHLIMSPKAH